MRTEFDNAALAERLDAFAALLDLAGASYHTARAYRRAAALVRSTPAPVAESCVRATCGRCAGSARGSSGGWSSWWKPAGSRSWKSRTARFAPEIVGLGRFWLVGEAGGRDRGIIGRGHRRGVPSGDQGGAAAGRARSRAEDRGEASGGARARRAAVAARADVEPRAGPRGADRRGPERGRRGGRAALARCVRAPRYCQFRQQCSRSFSRVAPDRGRRGRHGRRYRRGCAARAVVAPQGEFGTAPCARPAPRSTSARSSRSPAATRRGLRRAGRPVVPARAAGGAPQAGASAAARASGCPRRPPLPYNSVRREGERPRDGRGSA